MKRPIITRLLELLLVVVVVVLAGTDTDHAWRTGPPHFARTALAQAAPANPYQGWKTYTSPAEPDLTLRYPLTWKVAAVPSKSSIGAVTITSPNGTTVTYNPAAVTASCSGPTHVLYYGSIEAITGAPGLYEVALSDHATINELAVAGRNSMGTGPASGAAASPCAGFLPTFASNVSTSRSISVSAARVATADQTTTRLLLASLTYPPYPASWTTASLSSEHLAFAYSASDWTLNIMPGSTGSGVNQLATLKSKDGYQLSIESLVPGSFPAKSLGAGGQEQFPDRLGGIILNNQQLYILGDSADAAETSLITLSSCVGPAKCLALSPSTHDPLDVALTRLANGSPADNQAPALFDAASSTPVEALDIIHTLHYQ